MIYLYGLILSTLISGYLGFRLYKLGQTKWAWGTWIIDLIFIINIIFALFDSESTQPSTNGSIAAWLLVISPVVISVIGLYASNKGRGDWALCPECDTATPVSWVQYFYEDEQISTSILTWLALLIWSGAIYFGIGYIVIVGIDGFFLYAVTIGLIGVYQGYLTIMKIIEFRRLKPNADIKQHYKCPGCKHEWVTV